MWECDPYKSAEKCGPLPTTRTGGHVDDIARQIADVKAMQFQTVEGMNMKTSLLHALNRSLIHQRTIAKLKAELSAYHDLQRRENQEPE